MAAGAEVLCSLMLQRISPHPFVPAKAGTEFLREERKTGFPLARERTARRLRSKLLTLLLVAFPTPALATPLPPGFVYLRDIEPGIAQDMRYAGYDNFTGRPLPGYDAAECVLRREVALALKAVQADLAPAGLGLKVYDCYRPERAVAAFARWARAPDTAATKRFYPALDKRALFAQGYIATQSRHSTGTAVDLTLVSLEASPSPAARPRAKAQSASPSPFVPMQAGTQGQPAPPRSVTLDPRVRGDDRVISRAGRTEQARTAPVERNAAYAACTAPAGERAPDNSVDMGTGFDCFDAKSHTASSVTAEQRRWRDMLVAAMRRRGLHNYFREWWHFGFGARPAQAYDFPIAPR